MEIQGLKQNVLMGKLKQHLPPGVSPDTDLFLAMFLVRLPPSIHEMVGAGNHKMAAAMVKAADALWDAQGGYDPTVAAAMTQQSRSPAPNNAKGGNKQSGNACSKSYLPALIFTLFRTLAMACVNFTSTMPIRLTGVFHPVHGQKTYLPLNHFWFPANAGLIFLTDKLTNDRYLVDTGAILSIVPCSQNSSPSGPLLKGADGQPIPSWGFIKKTAIPRQIFYIHFLATPLVDGQTSCLLPYPHM